MSTRHEDNDGSDIFWPGYVDATTNLILNLLFLLTILIVAVFMFALELGRSSPVTAESPPASSSNEEAKDVPAATNSQMEAISTAANDFESAISIASADLEEAVSPLLSKHSEGVVSLIPEPSAETSSAATRELLETLATATDDLLDVVATVTSATADENAALKSEVQRLNQLLNEKSAHSVQAGGVVRTVEATLMQEKPLVGIDEAVATDHEVIVRFAEDSVAFKSAERERLLDSLKPIVANGETSILVEVPEGFSEAKRMGFYRAMAVRNLLIEMQAPQEAIDVLVVEVKQNANASIVRVRSR